MILWFLYTFYEVYRNYKGRREVTLTAQLLQAILVLLALRWAWTHHILTRNLWSPLDIGAGLLLGHLMFVLSLGITHRHTGDVLSHAADLRGICSFACKTPDICLRFLGVAAIEEVVYRAGAQDMLLYAWNRPAPAIGVTAACFCLLHTHFLRTGLVSALEFVLFSLAIGLLYYHTASLTMVLLAHTVRNLESAYLEFCLLLEDTHDEAEALRLLDKRYALSVLESA